MSLIPLVLVLFFIAANIFAELMRKDLNPLVDPMSSYLTGPYGAVQSASYVGLSVCLMLLFPRLSAPAWHISLIVAAIAVLTVVATKWIMLSNSTQHASLERIHVIAAGLAFLGVTIAEIVFFWHTQYELLSFAAPASAVAWSRLAPTKTALEEKSYAALICVGLLVITALPLHI